MRGLEGIELPDAIEARGGSKPASERLANEEGSERTTVFVNNPLKNEEGKETMSIDEIGATPHLFANCGLTEDLEFFCEAFEAMPRTLQGLQERLVALSLVHISEDFTLQDFEMEAVGASIDSVRLAIAAIPATCEIDLWRKACCFVDAEPRLAANALLPIIARASLTADAHTLYADALPSWLLHLPVIQASQSSGSCPLHGSETQASKSEQKDNRSDEVIDLLILRAIAADDGHLDGLATTLRVDKRAFEHRVANLEARGAIRTRADRTLRLVHSSAD